jgi:hypothetical protein
MKPYSSNFVAKGVSADKGFVLKIAEDLFGLEASNKQRPKISKHALLIITPSKDI